MAVKLSDVLKDKKLLAVCIAYAERAHTEENINFLVDVDKLGNEGLFKKYIARNAPDELNLDSDELKGMRALGDKKDWKSPDWKKFLQSAEATISKLWASNDGNKLETSKEYLAWADANKPKIKANPAKAAKLLGIADVGKLTKAMQAQIDGDDKTALRLYGEIAKEEKLKDKAEALMKVLEKAGLA